MERKSAFCPSTAKISGEHIWSQWMATPVPPAAVNFSKIETDGSVRRRWRMMCLDMTANVVCKVCNETWMSRIESQYAKPAMSDLILGKQMKEITEDRAHGISLFAFKTAVIANRMLSEDEEFFDISQRYAFRESLSIPPKVGMYLLGFAPENAGGFRSMNIYFPNQNAPKLTLNVCSFHVGQFGFQVVSAKTLTVTQIESLPTPDNLKPVLFYPTIRSGVSWPQTVVLAVKALHLFPPRCTHSRFKYFVSQPLPRL